MRSYSKGKTLIVRNPNSTRPWQNVLDVIYGYLTLASKLYSNPKLHGESFNFGPSFKSNYSVNYLLTKIKKYLPELNWKIKNDNKKFFESKLLKLNSTKAKKKLNWKSILTIDENAKLVSEWYKQYYKNKGKNLSQISINQINNYLNKK